MLRIPLVTALAAFLLLSACDSDSGTPEAHDNDIEVIAVADTEDTADTDRADQSDASTAGDTGPSSGEFSLLNYNVKGLPQGISGRFDPVETSPLISPLLNDFDIALVQEDFWYHDLISASVEHPYQSENIPNTIGDGLNRFSNYPFTDHTRVPWPSCHGVDECGADCLAEKGFSVARHQLAPGVEIDIYNLHNEAGRCAEDYPIRADSTDLIIETIAARSDGVAVIVAGDFNLLANDEGDDEALAQWQDMVDVCVVLECDTPNRRERTYLQDGDTVRLIALDYSLDDEAFYFDEVEGRAGNGRLSDHPPQWAVIGWELIE